MASLPSPDHTRIRAAESRIEFAVAGAFTILIAGTLAYVHSLFAEIVPAWRLWSWTVMVIIVVVVMVLVPVLVFLRKPDDAEIMRIWSPVGKLCAILFDTAVAASVWMLLPYASEPLRLLMVIFYAACVSGQVISTAESLGTILYGVVTIFGSAAIFFLINPGPYSVPLSLFLAAFGALMIGVAATLKVAIRSAIRARLDAEAISAELTATRDAKMRFIAAATHDLRQPLQAAALFFTHVAKRDTGAEDRHGTVANAKLAFEEAASLLDRLLDHLRLDSGMIQPTLDTIAIGDVLARLHEEIAPLAAASGFTIACVATRQNAVADPHLLARVLRNLIHNAMRHSRGTRIVVGARRRGDQVRIHVIDNGRGVPDREVPTLFADFRLAAESSGRRGIGLGLPSSRKMAELMGGGVAFEPRWRRGAAFYVELPRGA
jgi:signal transduction histidine kinase